MIMFAIIITSLSLYTYTNAYAQTRVKQIPCMVKFIGAGMTVQSVKLEQERHLIHTHTHTQTPTRQTWVKKIPCMAKFIGAGMTVQSQLNSNTHTNNCQACESYRAKDDTMKDSPPLVCDK